MQVFDFEKDIDMKKLDKTNTRTEIQAPLSSKGRFWRNLYRDRQLYLFMLIPFAYIIIFAYVPMYGLQIAFKSFKPKLGIWGSPWVGFDQFVKFFKSYQFSRVVPNTLILSFYAIIAAFPIPIVYALMLNSLTNDRFKKVTSNITNLPHFISVVVTVGILTQVFNPRTGLYGSIVMSLTGAYPSDPFKSAENFRHFYVWSGVWQNFGWDSIIYTAALAAVSPEQHEAAQIDGASRFQRVLHVDLPAILPTIVIMMILRCGKVMSVGFEKVWLLQNSLNLNASEVISTYIYKMGIASTGTTDYSYSTAIGFFNSAINLILISLVNWVSKKVGETSLW